MTFSIIYPVVSIGISPTNIVHNFGYGCRFVFGSLDEEMDVGIHNTVGEEFEFVFGFVANNGRDKEVEVGLRGNKRFGVITTNCYVVTGIRS